MAKRDDIYGTDAIARFYNDVVNSPSMQAARKFASSSSIQHGMQYAISSEYQEAVQKASLVQGVLNRIKPAYLDVPLYNESAIRAMTQAARAATTDMQGTVNIIQRMLPDMTVLNSLSHTVAALAPVYDSIQGVVEFMRPLWESGYVQSVNPKAVWPCMENEEELHEQIKDEAIDEEEFTNDVSEMITSDNPENAMNLFVVKWRNKIAKAAFSAITGIALIIASGKIQYEMQPIYQVTPHLPIVNVQVQEKCMNRNEVEFSVFCIENVATRLEITGEETYQLFTEHANILDEYIIPNYEVLHTQSKDYIVNDIIDYMKECGVLK